MKRNLAGYSLIEILVVLGVVAILLGVGAVTLVGYQRNLTTQQAVTMVVTDLNRARSQARKTSQDWQVVFSANQNRYQIQRAGITLQTIELPGGVRVGNLANNPLVVQYTAPFGLRPQGSISLKIPVLGVGSRQGKINIVGITGKVVVVE